MVSSRSLTVSSLVLLLGCTGDSAQQLVVEAQVNDTVHTVVDLTWATDDPGVSWVEFGEDPDALGRSTPMSESAETEHEVALYGLRPLTTVHYEVFTQTDDALLSVTGSIETEGLPSDLPELSVTAYEPDLASSAAYAMIILMGEPGAILVLDREGETVWYRRLASEIDDTAFFHSEVQFSEHHQQILYNAYGPELDDYVGGIQRLTFGGRYAETTETPLGHHDFVQLGEGALAWLAADVRSWYDPDVGEEVDVVGDAIVELQADGTERTVFSTWDWKEPHKTGRWDDTFWSRGQDWTHANALDYDASADTLLMSLGNLDTLVEVDRETGEVVHEYGPEGDYRIPPSSKRFVFQHDPQWTDEGTLLMYTAAPSGTENIAVEFALDHDEGLLRDTWSYGEGEGLATFAEGKVLRADNGNTLISWSTAGVVREVTPAGEIAWEVQSDVGFALLNVVLFDDFYTHAEARR